MKKLKKITTVLMAVILFSILIPVSVNQNTVIVQAATAKISKSSLTLMKGQSSTLRIIGVSGKITWKSSNQSIVTVLDGVVKGVKNGTAIVTATVDGKSYKCKVSVLPTFKVVNKDIVKELTGRYMTWNNQQFMIEANDIANVEIEDTTTSSDKLTKTVTVNMTIDRTVAKLNVTAVITYTGNTKKWTVSNVDMTANVEEYNISGSYVGNALINPYDTNFLSRYMELTVENMKSDGIFTGTMTFSANADSPTAETNVYNIKGGINVGTGVITIVVMEHVSGSDNWNNLDKNSSDNGFYVDVVNRGISGSHVYGYYGKFAKSLTLTKNDPNSIPIK